MGGLRSYSLRTLAPGPAGSWEEERGLISVSALFRMSKLRLAEGLVGVSGVSIPIGNSEESKESPGSTWPKDLIALKPGETSWDVVLKKIKELSDSVEGEGEGRREEGRGCLSPCFGGQEIRLSVFWFYVSFLGLISKLCSAGGDRITLSPSNSLPMPPFGGFAQCKAAWLKVGAVFPPS